MCSKKQASGMSSPSSSWSPQAGCCGSFCGRAQNPVIATEPLPRGPAPGAWGESGDPPPRKTCHPVEKDTGQLSSTGWTVLPRGTPGVGGGKKMRRGLREEVMRARGRGRDRANTYARPQSQGSLVARDGLYPRASGSTGGFRRQEHVQLCEEGSLAMSVGGDWRQREWVQPGQELRAAVGMGASRGRETKGVDLYPPQDSLRSTSLLASHDCQGKDQRAGWGLWCPCQVWPATPSWGPCCTPA